MDACLLLVLYIVRQKSLRQADHSSREVPATVVRRCVWTRNLKNEDAMARAGPHWTAAPRGGDLVQKSGIENLPKKGRKTSKAFSRTGK